MNTREFFMKEKMLGLEKLSIMSKHGLDLNYGDYIYYLKDAYKRGKRNIFIIERIDGQKCLIASTTDRECENDVLETYDIYTSKKDQFDAIVDLTLFQRLLKKANRIKVSSAFMSSTANGIRVNSIFMFTTDKMIALQIRNAESVPRSEESEEYGMCLVCNLDIEGKDRYLVITKHLSKFICIGDKDREYSKYSGKKYYNNKSVRIAGKNVMYVVDRVDRVDFDSIKELDMQYGVDWY